MACGPLQLRWGGASSLFSRPQPPTPSHSHWLEGTPSPELQCTAGPVSAHLPRLWPRNTPTLRVLQVGFQEKVARNISTVSSFALYLCFPYYLDYQTLSDYDQKMHHKKIEETAYLIAQKGHTKWPSYQIRTHSRPLPQVVEWLMGSVPGRATDGQIATHGTA